MTRLNIPLLAFTTALIIALLPKAVAQTCNSTNPCPSTAPCCSEYGYCETGSYCLGGCEPLYSHEITSCRPDPICTSFKTDFNDLSRVQQNASLYDGNATAYDWVVNTGSLVASPSNDGARLILTQNNIGSKISSTRYLHYGTIDFTLKTSKWAGVVTAAITMSDVKDEIDWEWPGADIDKVQTNYWFLGVANYSATEGASSSVSSDTTTNFHTYTIDWQENYINWSIDGLVVRTVRKTDAISEDERQYKFPPTPSRVQISIWPAGTDDNAQGTIDWAGGYIDWTNSDYLSNGYFWNTIKSVNISCAYDTASTNGATGWAYSGNDTSGIPVVTTTNASTLISAGWKRIAGVQINNREIGGGGLHIIIGCVLFGGVALFY
uniref:GH16 domain-containing protein n=1 Tax=Cryptococcus bacillisporus CA1280 TaxID=1296109 RepID=A0A0D0TNV2_CRYGA|nr:hypothetical protein I312_02272 [Cryptococcus bacillisporus CA1280]